MSTRRYLLFFGCLPILMAFGASPKRLVYAYDALGNRVEGGDTPMPPTIAG